MKNIFLGLICLASFNIQAMEYEPQFENDQISPPIREYKKENSHDISINIKINCPKSDEFQEFIKSIPPAGNYSSSFNEWKSSFVNNMNQLIHLVESEKIFNSWWSVNTDAHFPQEAKGE